MRVLRRHGLLPVICGLFLVTSAEAQFEPRQKISQTQGGFVGDLTDNDRFGYSVANLGDVDLDGVADLAVGAPGIDPVGTARGAVWIVFLNADGTAKGQRKIVLEGLVGAFFGGALAATGDLDGDAIPDLSVTSNIKHWIILLNRDGSKKDAHETGLCSAGTPVGQISVCSTTMIRSYFGDGSHLLALGNPAEGSVTTLRLRDDFTTSELIRIDKSTKGNFTGRFGTSLSAIGGTGDLVLFSGAPETVEGQDDYGLVWQLAFGAFPSGTDFSDWYRGATRIDARSAGLADLGSGDRFGSSVGFVDGIEGDSATALVIGAPGDDSGGGNVGAIWVLFTDSGLNVQRSTRISASSAGIDGIDAADEFGTSITPLGDLNYDGIVDLAVGAPGDDDGGANRGAVWILSTLVASEPTISIHGQENETHPVDRDIEIEAVVQATHGVDQVKLVIRRGGDKNAFSTDMALRGANTFLGSIPAGLVTERGVGFYVEATPTVGVVGRHPDAGFLSLPITLSEGRTLVVEGGTEQNAYRLISIPYRLDNPSAASVLEDDLGMYRRSNWRFFTLGENEKPIEYGKAEITVTPGNAYWLLVKDANTLVDTGPGTTVSIAENFHVALNRGWNLVSNPFGFDVPFTSVSLLSGAPLDVRSYQGSWGLPGNHMVPYSGYALFVEAGSDTLVVDPHVSNISKKAVAGPNKTSTLAWAVRVVATKGTARDDDNILGVADTGKPDWDSADRPEPPVVGDYVAAYFAHPEWKRTASKYSSDVRSLYPSGRNGWTWRLDITARRPGRVDLTFQNVAGVPFEYEVVLRDPASGAAVDLRDEPAYSLVVPGESDGLTRVVEIQVGAETEYGESGQPPKGTESLRVFPNPFTASTMIVFETDTDDTPELCAFDITGRHVATLELQAAPRRGLASLVWDATSDKGHLLPSGLYILQLRSGRQVESLPVIVAR